jgi:hypothetical protein
MFSYSVPLSWPITECFRLPFLFLDQSLNVFVFRSSFLTNHRMFSSSVPLSWPITECSRLPFFFLDQSPNVFVFRSSFLTSYRIVSSSVSLSWPIIECSRLPFLFLDQSQNVFVFRSSFLTNHRMVSKGNTTGATSGLGAAFQSRAPQFTPGFCLGLSCSISVQCFVDHCLFLFYFFVWPLYCLAFDLRLLITSVVYKLFLIHQDRVLNPLLFLDQ